MSMRRLAWCWERTDCVDVGVLHVKMMMHEEKSHGDDSFWERHL